MLDIFPTQKYIYQVKWRYSNDNKNVGNSDHDCFENNIAPNINENPTFCVGYIFCKYIRDKTVGSYQGC